MLVKNYIIPKEKLVTVQLDDNIGYVLQILEDNDFMSIPVFSGLEFIGIVYKAHIYQRFFKGTHDRSEFLALPVDVLTIRKKDGIQENTLLEDAASHLVSGKKTFIPVFNGEEFKGILTHSSIFNALAKVLGGNGHRIQLHCFNMKGALANITKIVADSDANITSLVVEDAEVMNIFRVILRVEKGCNLALLKIALEDRGFNIERID